MALWELDAFQGPEFLGYVRGIPTSNLHLGAQLLPDQQTDDLSFSYIRGVNNRPVMAHVMGYDSEAPIGGRAGLGDEVAGELPPIKRKSKITEKELIRFLQPRANSNDKQAAIDSVYDLTDGLVSGIQDRVEWLRMQALSEDTVDYDEGGVKFKFDFGINDKFQLDLPTKQDGAGVSVPQLGDAWSQVNTADPISDLVYICDLVGATTGFRPARMVLRRKVLSYLQQNKKIRELLKGVNAPTGIVTTTEIASLFALYDLPVIIEYSATMVREKADGSQEVVSPLDEEKVILLPAENIGNTLWGPTAESRVLIGTKLSAQAPGIMAVTYGTEEPPAEWVKAAAVSFPTMPNVHQLAQLEVA